MNIKVFDVESDALLDRITKIHCLCYYDINKEESVTLTNYEEIRELFNEKETIFLAHNGIRFDIPALKKVVGIEEPEWLVDSLAISWYLFPERKRHGLEEWGEELGIGKPVIEDWGEGNIEAIIHRCQEDVKINTKLWKKFEAILLQLYSKEKLEEFLKYLYFKLDCIREQEEVGIKFDKEKCQKHLELWEREKEEKVRELEEAMPKVAIFKIKEYPKAITRKDGTFSKQGELWFDLLKEEGLPIENVKEVKTITGYKEPNANSHEQIKNWLYSLGWKPEHIKHVRDKQTNKTKQIPQIASKLGGGDVCDSIKKLYDQEPKLSLLEGLTVVSHRISILKAFLEDEQEGRLFPSMAGLTNTLRLKHKTIVNLPAVEKKYGEQVRELLIADEGAILCGSDLANIEDRTKRHYIYKYDPQYVEEMNIPGYDAHLEIAVLANFMTIDDMVFYKELEIKKRDEDFIPTKEEKEKFSNLKAIRNKSKITNFSATYKIGAEALARNANIPLKEAKKLLHIYWERNKAILLVEKECLIMEAGGKRWLLNPISGFWYSLRNDKDKFSTLNQGTAVYCFDIWLQFIRQQGIKIALQYHDEILFNVIFGGEEGVKEKIRKAIELTNNKLQLNVSVGCSIQWGYNYAQCH